MDASGGGSSGRRSRADAQARLPCGVARWAVALTSVALLAGWAAFALTSDEAAGAPAGETEQGFRALLLDAPDGEVRLRLLADCEPPSGSGFTSPYEIPLAGHDLTARIGQGGGFAIDESYVEEWTDGDEAHVVVTVDGEVESDGTASGVLQADLRVWNGQSSAFTMRCDTGGVRWSATPAQTRRISRDVPVPGVVGIESSAGDLVAFTADGRPLTIGAGGAGEPVGAPLWDPGTAVDRYVGVLAAAGSGAWTYGQPGAGGFGFVRTDLVTGDRTTVAKQVLASASEDGALFFSTVRDEQVHLERVDPVTGDTLVSVPTEGGRLAVDDTHVWLLPHDGTSVLGFDRDTLELRAEHPIDGPAHDIAVGAGGLWLSEESTLSFLDIASGRESVVDLPGVAAVVGDDRGAWVSQPREQVLRRIEGGAVVAVVDLPGPAWDLERTEGGGLWVSVEDHVLQVDD